MDEVARQRGQLGGSLSKQALKRAAQKSKEMEEKESRKHEQERHDYDRRGGVNGSHPRKPDRQRIFSQAEQPITERLRAGVDSSARTRFRAVRGQRHATG